MDKAVIPEQFKSKLQGAQSVKPTTGGLQLVTNMYVAFQIFAPSQGVGVDFSKEYKIAVGQLE